MSPGGKVRPHSCPPEGFHQISEFPEIVLKDDRETDEFWTFLQRGLNHAVIGIRGIGDQAGSVTLGLQVRHDVPEPQVLLVLPTDKHCIHCNCPCEMDYRDLALA